MSRVTWGPADCALPADRAAGHAYPRAGRMSPPRLLVFATHPIQYQAPLFRALAADPRVSLEVIFARVPDAVEQAEGFGGAFTWDLPLRDGYPSDVLPAIGLPSSLRSALRRPVRGIGAAIDHFRPDAALIFGWHEASQLQALIAARRRGIPLLMRCEANEKRQRSALKRAAQRAIVAGLAGALAIGKSNRAFYLARGLDPSRIVDARYFVDNAFFATSAAALASQRAALRARFGIAEGALAVLFAGKFEAKKRPLALIEAAAAARQAGADIHLLLVGSGELGPAMADRVRALSVPATFTGFLNQTAMPEAYAACDATALLSDVNETWGLVVNEAFASGRTALVSRDVGCADDLVEDGVTGAVVGPDTVGRAASILGDWAGDRAHLARLSLAAKERVTREYSVASSSAAMIEMLDRTTRRDASR